MKHTITRTLVAAGSAALALTACGSPNAGDEAAHVERLQELDAVKQSQLENEQFNNRIQPTETAEPAEVAEPTEQATSDASYADPEAWKNERVQQYRDNYTKTYSIVCAEALEYYAGCGAEDPHSHLADITAPNVGHLVVTLDEGAWSTGFAAEFPAEYVASGIMHFTSFDATDVEKITVEMPDGTSYTKDRHPLEYDAMYGQEVIPATS